MRTKIKPIKPYIIMLYGYPGSGKTSFAKNFSKEIKCAHLDINKLVYELGASKPQNSKQAIDMMSTIANEFIKSDVGVIFDMNLPKRAERKKIIEFAKHNKVQCLALWLQIDIETAKHRAMSRDNRKNEDKYSKKYTEQEFNGLVNMMQNPVEEDTIVVSGKHNYNSQKTSVIKKLLQYGLIKSEEFSQRVTKPELMSFIPKPSLSGGDHNEKRNISIN